MNKQNERKLRPIQDVITRWNSLIEIFFLYQSIYLIIF
jgi:hypothetical protein